MDVSEEPDDLNGLLLQSYYIPEEVVSLILSFVDTKSLVFSCRSVCKLWKYLIDEDVWRIRLRTAKQRSLSKLSSTERLALKLPSYVYYAIFAYDPFEKNLLKNHCGQDSMAHWFTRSRGGEEVPPEVANGQWEVEIIPQGSDPLPQHEDFNNCTSCFVSSFRTCKKSQIIDLSSYGISSKIMDEYQPTITASEWFAGRFDCGCKYIFTVRLLDKDRNILRDEKSLPKFVKQWEGSTWEKVEITLKDYGPNVKYIEFEHQGRDTQFWAGHYGTKMSGAMVKISLPKSKRTDT